LWLKFVNLTNVQNMYVYWPETCYCITRRLFKEVIICRFLVALFGTFSNVYILEMAASQILTWSTRYPVESSHGKLITGQLVITSTRHAFDASQTDGQLDTVHGHLVASKSKQTWKPYCRSSITTRSLRSPPLHIKCPRKRADNKVHDSARKSNKMKQKMWIHI